MYAALHFSCKKLHIATPHKIRADVIEFTCGRNWEDKSYGENLVV